MSTLPEKFLALRETGLDFIGETFLSDPKSYFRSSSKKAFSRMVKFDLVTKRLDIKTAFELVTWLEDNCEGTHGIFKVNNPFNALLPTKETANIITQSTANQFAKSVNCQGFTPNIVDAMEVGTFFNFGNHPKAYQVTNLPSADGSGSGVITFTPGLFADVPAGTSINYGADAVFTGSSTADVSSLDISVKAAKRASIVIPFQERSDL